MDCLSDSQIASMMSFSKSSYEREWGHGCGCGGYCWARRRCLPQRPPAWALDSAAHSETVAVTGRAADLTGIAASANQGSVNAFDLELRLCRPGEIVEHIPASSSLSIGQRQSQRVFPARLQSRSWHDLAIDVDGMPVNMPSHGHGQGYSDLNFAIPELIQRGSITRRDHTMPMSAISVPPAPSPFTITM